MTDSFFSPDAVDVQSTRPATTLSLSRVGVRGVEKVLRIATPAGERTYFAELECVVDLNPQQAGVHMSRFEETVNEAIDGVVIDEALRAEQLAAHIAERVLATQQGLRAEVSLAARYAETVPAPASRIPTQEIYTLLGTAVASPTRTRTVVGVEAQGMTACPCAQELVADRARTRLVADGFTDDEIERVFDAVPVATHNQRGIGRLQIGADDPDGPPIDARQLLAIVEQSMSSEIYELMKRSDEVTVVERAHRNPRFVEDCVREMIRRVCAEFPWLGPGAFVAARQENLETIHRHNVVAERHGTVGDLRAELEAGEHSAEHVRIGDWLSSVTAGG